MRTCSSFCSSVLLGIAAILCAHVLRAAPPPQILTLTATPSTTTAPQPTTLAWTTANATQVFIVGLLNGGPPNGSFTATPTSTTTYKLEAWNAAGQYDSKELTVTVVQPQPTATFTATPAEIQPGESSTLAWNVQYAGNVTIQPGIGVVLPVDSKTVKPASTTTYTLMGTGAGGTVIRTATITVAEPPQIPVILAFAATPANIAEGSSTTLSWLTANAANVFISGGIGSAPPIGSAVVSPAATTTYHLTAFGAGGTANADVTIAVHAAPSIIFTATPDRIALGQTATLTWVVMGASTVELDHGIGLQGPAGTTEVKPDATTTYLLTASGPGGTRIGAASITVIVPKRRAARH